MRTGLLSFAILISNCAFGHGIIPVDQLKSDVQGVMQIAPEEVKKAEAMQLIKVPDGQWLSEEACEALATKIRATYKVDPFKYVYSHKTFTLVYKDLICGGDYREPSERETNRLVLQSGFSSLGLPYTMVIQRDSGVGRFNYFIDDSGKIVQVQKHQNIPNGLSGYSVAAVDVDGSIYVSGFNERIYIDPTKGTPAGGVYGMRGHSFYSKVVKADGSFILRHSRDLHPQHQSLNKEHYDYRRVEKTDGFVPVLTYKEGIYFQEGKPYDILRDPIHSSEFVVRYVGGKEVCAYGTKRDAKGFSISPSYEECSTGKIEDNFISMTKEDFEKSKRR